MKYTISFLFETAEGSGTYSSTCPDGETKGRHITLVEPIHPPLLPEIGDHVDVGNDSSWKVQDRNFSIFANPDEPDLDGYLGPATFIDLMVG